MLTIKLYRPGVSRIAEADFITVVDEDAGPHLKLITLHRANGGDECYYVGAQTPATAYADAYKIYDRAIVENASGKTTEMIFATPLLAPQAA